MSRYRAAGLVLGVGVGILAMAGCGKATFGGGGRISSEYDHAEKYTSGGGSTEKMLTKLDLNWISGDINIVTGSGNEILFSEDANQDLDEDTSMHYWVDGDTLHIQYCKAGDVVLKNNLDKQLTVTLPESCYLEECLVDTVSSDIHANGITSEEIQVDSVSGTTSLSDCNVSKKIRVESVSGEIDLDLTTELEEISVATISGSCNIQVPFVENFFSGSTSGDVELVVERSPKKVKADSISGKVTFALPEDLSAVISFDSISGKLNSDLAGTVKGDSYIFGDGDGDYKIETTSGDFAIVKR